jgi:DNA-binding CsgD family transcriptional regulator
VARVQRSRERQEPRDVQSWSDVFAELSRADRSDRLGAEGLERLAVAAYLVGEDAACERAWIEAHHSWMDNGDAPRAAMSAFRLALGLFFRGDLTLASGWVSRGATCLADHEGDGVERAWLLMLTALPRLFAGEGDLHDTYVEGQTIADRVGDADAAMFARMCRGYALISEGRVREGLGCLDEAMIAVSAGEVSPIVSGIAYCQVISLCQTVFDLRRAREWTEALTRWCDAQPDLVPFKGHCLVHRCEVFQVSGAWATAFDEAARACQVLAGPPPWDVLGSAFYQLAEIQRLRGDFVGAETSYRRASAAGRDPQPGISLLELAQGRVDHAVSALGRALDEASDPPLRARLLPAFVEALLGAEQISTAAAAADELVEIGERLDATLVHAAAAQALGAVQLAQGDARRALTTLRQAQRRWVELGAPYELARVRTLVAVACLDLGDGVTAGLEFEAARTGLEELGAHPDLAALSRSADSPQGTAGLSPRESEVLALVATGKTNRAIARELSITEKTVARHVANIFVKTGVSSRAEATAYAFKQGLVR